jgi:hypothetical protein
VAEGSRDLTMRETVSGMASGSVIDDYPCSFDNDSLCQVRFQGA